MIYPRETLMFVSHLGKESNQWSAGIFGTYGRHFTIRKSYHGGGRVTVWRYFCCLRTQIIAIIEGTMNFLYQNIIMECSSICLWNEDEIELGYEANWSRTQESECLKKKVWKILSQQELEMSCSFLKTYQHVWIKEAKAG